MPRLKSASMGLQVARKKGVFEQLPKNSLKNMERSAYFFLNNPFILPLALENLLSFLAGAGSAAGSLAAGAVSA